MIKFGSNKDRDHILHGSSDSRIDGNFNKKNLRSGGDTGDRLNQIGKWL